MTDLSHMTHAVQADDRTPCVDLDGARYTSAEALVAAVPDVVAPGNEIALTRAVTHLARGNLYCVVTDPQAFEADYRAALDAEDPTAPWRQGQPRRGDFGLPDFSKVTAPRREGDSLRFTVEDNYTGYPYEVRVALSAPHALDLTPLPVVQSAATAPVAAPDDASPNTSTERSG